MPVHPSRAQLELIIEGLSDGVLIVEPNERIAFANKAALVMHGVERQEDLGGTVDEYRRRFVLHYRNNHTLVSNDYPMERVVAGQTFAEMVVVVSCPDRPGREWTHRIRSLVITDEDGKPDCLVLILQDVTEHYEAHERFERVFSANPAPSLICRLSDLRYVKLNEGFLDLTGFEREAVLGRTLYDLDVLHEAEQRDLAIERLRAGRTIPQMEACLCVPTDADKLVIVAGQPIEYDDDPCMLFTFADLEPRRQAERALKESEERFVTSFRLSPIPTTIGRLDPHQFTEVNDAFVQALGYTAEELVGQTVERVGLWTDEVAFSRFRRDLARHGSVLAQEAVLRGKDGAEHTCLVSADVVTIDGQPSVLCAFQDITSRKRSEGELVQAIETVMADASWFSRAVVEKLGALRQSARTGKPVEGGLADLTAREQEVLALVCKGQSDSEIASSLNVARNTVRNHVAAVYRKIGVTRRSAAIVWARERGFGGEEAAPRQKRQRRA